MPATDGNGEATEMGLGKGEKGVPTRAVTPRKLHLRRGHAAHLFARALVDVFPGSRILVDGALAGAGVLAGGAIVLPCLGDSVTLVLGGLRGRRGCRGGARRKAERKEAGNGCLDGGLFH